MRWPRHSVLHHARKADMLLLTGGPRNVRSLWFGPDGRTLVAGNWDGVARRWRLDAPAAPAGLDRDDADAGRDEPPTDPRVRLVTVGRNRRYDEYGYTDSRWTVAADPDCYPQAVAVLADGERFVAAERASDAADAWLCVRSLADGAELLRLPFRYASAVVLAAVPHSARVVGTAGGRLLVWDCDAGTVQEVPGRGRKLWKDLAAHPDGRWVAAVNNTPHVSLLDPRAATVAVEFGPGAGPLTAVAVSPDGLLWAAAGSEGRVAVWDDDG